MYTSAHIIAHLHEIAGAWYVRLVAANHTAEYAAEVAVAYSVEAPTLGETFHVFYNCGDLYERLLHDVKFKKFRGVTMEAACDNMMKITTDVEIIPWFRDVYIPWMRTKLASYVSDLDDTASFYTCDPTQFPWDSCNLSTYVSTEISEEGDKTFRLHNYESPDGKHVILSQMHMFILVLRLMEHNPQLHRFCELNEKMNNVPVLVETGTSITPCEFDRGVQIDKHEITKYDIENILNSCGLLNSSILKSIVDTEEYNKYMLQTIECTVYIPAESDPFRTQYSFNPDFEYCVNTKGSWEDMFEFQSVSKYNKHSFELTALHTMSGLQKIFEAENAMSKNVNKTTTAYIYKNPLTNTVFFLEVALTYLKEFDSLSKFDYQHQTTQDVVDIINKNKSISTDVIKELKTLISIIDDTHEEEEDEQNVDTSELQRQFTHVYAHTHKNDAKETMANVVIDNVYKYLSNHMNPEKGINKNQIGKDLVEFGIKKVRKAKGYVYGIEDTSAPSGAAVVVDQGKVEVSNLQLRKEPVIPVTSFDNVMWMQPSRFMSVIGKK